MPRKTRRRWHALPPLTHGPEALEGGGILAEHESELGVLLWQALRDVMLWAVVPPEERPGLFAAKAATRRRQALKGKAVPARLRTLMKELTLLLSDPAAATDEGIKEACLQVGQWAEGEGYLATALAFVQAAAVTAPRDAAAAYKVGQLARQRVEYARAETWFRRSIALGRQIGDWPSYVVGCLGLGNLYRARGNLPGAQRLHLRGLRTARRHSLHELEGAALHDLFADAADSGEPRLAEEHARGAYERYGPRHPRLPALALDVGFFWLYQGHFARSLPVFQALVPYFSAPAERLLLFGNLARSAGGAGEEEVFEQARAEALALAEHPAAQSTAPGALLDLAYGAASLGRWELAEEVVARAFALARERGEAKNLVLAESVLDEVRRGRTAEVNRNRPVASPSNEPGDVLAKALVHSLQGHGVAG